MAEANLLEAKTDTKEAGKAMDFSSTEDGALEITSAEATPPTTAPAEEPISTAKQEEDIQQAVAEPRNEVVDKAVADGLEELLGGSSTPSSAPAQSQ